MKIGIIGAGNIGATVGKLFEDAHHDVRYGVRQPEGRGEAFVTVDAAAEYGEVVLFAGPFGALPDFGRECGAHLQGKILINAANAIPDRDGAVAEAVVDSGQGSAAYVATLLPHSDIVQSFNTIYWVDLRDKAGQPGERLAMPMVSNSHRATVVASELAVDVGFDPVNVGGLDRSIELDPGSAIYAKSMTAEAVRATLHLHEEHRA